MNKTMMLGIGIFFALLAGLVSLSTTADVNAQTILSNDTGVHPSVIYYQIDMSELGLTDQYQAIYENATNTTSIYNTTHTVDYDCTLFVDQETYSVDGYTTDVNDTISVNQTLNHTLDDSYHDIQSECLYYINTTNITSIAHGGENGINDTVNETVMDHTLILSSRNITEYKTLLVDATAPMIVLSNISGNTFLGNTSGSITLSLESNATYLDFSITDLSDVYCTLKTGSQNVSFNFTGMIGMTTSNITIPLSLAAGNHTVNVSCSDVLYNIGTAGYIISASYQNNMTNLTNMTNSTNLTNTTVDAPFFELSVSKPEFGLGEIGYYTLNATNNSNVSITICPAASGWVQCYMTPTFVNDTYPKTQAMPYTNKTGRYIIEGVMRYKNTTIVRNVTYETKNTLTASITASKTRGVVGDTITFNATANSGIAPYVYKWTMHDNTKFTGMGAYKKYNAAGTYIVNLTVNDSSGNNYSTSTEVVIKNRYTLTIVASDARNNNKLYDATVQVGDDSLQTNANGIAIFTLEEDTYDVRVSKNSYKTYSDDLKLDAAKTVYINLSFIDLTPPKVTLMTNDAVVLTQSTVDLKFKAEDSSNVACSLYIAEANNSWYSLKDSGDNLLVNTVYTFEIRDLGNGEYKWKVECSDADNNKAYSDERKFTVSDGSVAKALEVSDQSSDYINKALDGIDKLSGDESEIADLLEIRSDLKYLLDKINNMERDIHDLNFRRDLDADGRLEAQKNLTAYIGYLENNTPVSLSVKGSKTFVKYVRDEELESLLNEYSAIKNLNLDRKLFMESTKSIQSEVIISTRVRNVELYYLDGKTKEITLVIKDIKAATLEDAQAIKGSNTITFVEVIPKGICQSAKEITMLNKKYTVLKDDPIIEFPSDTESIAYYMEDRIDVDKFQDTDTILIDKDIGNIRSTTGMSTFNIEAISDIKLDGRGVMIVLIVVLLLFYIIINFDIIEKIRRMSMEFVGFGSKKKISFMRVLVNDALDYLKAEDYDKAALIYREIKLSYEEANVYIRGQVYDESFDLCNQLDLAYAMKILDKVDYFINIQDRNKAVIEFEKLQNTYNKLSEPYQAQIGEKFKKAMRLIKV